MLIPLLVACGIPQMLPEGPVLTPYERSLLRTGPSGATYTEAPRVDDPILPVIGWGVAYDLDLVIVDRSDAWDMHEYARIDGPDGPIWLAKDARIGTLEQTVVTALPDAAAFMPELPVRKQTGDLVVLDHSSDDRIDLDLTYTDIDGHPTAVHYEGPPPVKLEKERNGSTMGHSREQLLAVLDLPASAWAKKAEIHSDGEKVRLDRLAGLIPFRMALIQTQGGLATGRFALVPEIQDGFPTGTLVMTHHGPDGDVAEPWIVDPLQSDRYVLVQQADLREIRASFRLEHEALELEDIEIRQWGHSTPVAHIAFRPALPDLRMRFDGRVNSTFAVDVNGQESHAIGLASAYWDDRGAHVEITPQQPWWTADRPMVSDITFPANGGVDVDVHRVPTDNRSGTGARNQSPAP